MTTTRRIGVLFIALAVVLAALLVALPAQAATRKPGPVCTPKVAKKHPKRCVIIVYPKGTKPDQTIIVDLGAN